MSYVSLYRKYRSQTFEDVMGQSHVTKTLQNAIKLGKVAHAYLFCGTRGTGKTTTARLLAKALNCETGPTDKPCNTCSACVAVTEGAAIDIIEMDAASHRGVKDVEQIRDNVKYPPMELRYKVYIIDEAHQLSSDAKDAFLKTLEEPPPHAVFVLATTEPQSIPATIRSRCQQFDFRRGSLKDIRDRLKFVASSEGVEAEDAALDLVATNAEGSWRDAISLLEQVMSYTDERITVDDVHVVLGTVTLDFLFRLVDLLSGGDQRGAFEAAAEAVESGKDIQQLLKSIAQHLRNLLVASVTKNLTELTTNESLAEQYREQASRFDAATLLRQIEVFAEAEREIRFTDQHRLIFELALLKAMEALRPRETASPAPARQPIAQEKAPPMKAEPAPVAEPPAKSQSPAKPEPPAEKELLPEKPVEPASPAPVAHELPEFGRIMERWGQLLQHVKNLDRPAYGLLVEATPAEVRKGMLVLHFRYAAHVQLMDGDKSSKNTKRRALQTAIERTFGVPNVGIICEVKQDHAAPMTPKVQDGDDLPDPFEVPQENGRRDPLDMVLEEFPNSTIVDE